MPQRFALVEHIGEPSEKVGEVWDDLRTCMKALRRVISGGESTLCVEIDGRWVDIDKTEKVGR